MPVKLVLLVTARHLVKSIILLMADIRYHILNLENLSLPVKNTCLIINSRQGKTPRGNDQWVKSTINAVRNAINNQLTVICSIEINTWELVLWAVNEYGGNSIVILPCQKYSKNVDNLEYFIQDFNLNLDKVKLFFAGSYVKSGNRKEWWKIRDKLAYEMAYEITPISIRKGGFWANLLDNPLPDGKLINMSFLTPMAKASKHDRSMSIEIPQIDISYTWNCLTHWTRRFYEPWRGETSEDFYRKVVQSHDVYSHRAKDTLAKVIADQKLYGSSRWMRNNCSTVAFTSLHPADAVKLMKWRSRYVRYTFEPFGIAIDQQSGINAGISPVKYVKNGVKSSDICQTKGSNNFLLQGYGKADWTQEKEWRFSGDLDLSLFRKEDIRVIVPTDCDSIEFSQISPWKVVSLQSMKKNI